MSTWKMVKLGEVCLNKIDTLSTNENGFIDYIDIASIDNKLKKIVSYQTIEICNAPSRAKQLIESNDVLVSTVRPNLNAVAINDLKSCNLQVCSTGYSVLRCLPFADYRYIFYFCTSEIFINNMIKQATGASYPAVSNSIVKNSIIPLPPLEEQKRIADILDKASNVIELRKQQLEKMDLLIKSKFVDMFGDPVTNPKGFSVTTIENACTLKSGTSLQIDVENEGGEIPYIKVSDMNLLGNEKFVMTSSRFVSVKTAGKGIFNVGTVIFPKRGGAIGTNKKRLTVSKICADLNIMGVTPRKGILSEYLLAYFETIDLGSLNNGSSVPQINNNDINPLVINLPPIELQKQFAEFVEQVEKQKAVMQQSLEKMETNYKALMQEYFG